MLFVCLFVATRLLSLSDSSTINNNPGTVSIHENYDGTHNLWTISADCDVWYTVYTDCSYYERCGWNGWDTCYRSRTCSSTQYETHSCNYCYINSDTSGNFQMSGLTVQKKTCEDRYCGPTCNADGCLNGGELHSVGVTCRRTGYENDASVSGSFTVSVTNANGPSFYYNDGSSIRVSHDSAGVGSVINTIKPSTADDGNDYDYVRYRQNSGPGVSYLHSTADLFYLDTSNGQVKVGKDLTNEFSYYFSMNLCVYDRRHREVCHDLRITLWACFQTPNCTDQQELNLHDTYGTYTGHGGDSNVVFNMIYPQPSGHFIDFSNVWHDLTWTFDSNEFPEATINSDTGVIYITRNISIWPAWPTKDYNQVVRVSNSESCYTTTCRFLIRVHYTNWPIEIRSLPDSYDLHEDYDVEIKVHDLVVFDYNYHWEDNMTCEIYDWFPKEADLFELRHDGRYAYNSYTLYKLECQDPDCGYKYALPQPYYCYTDIGCLTYNRTQQYTVKIKCSDAYNSTDYEDFTFDVIKNEVPIYRHLPTHTDLDRQTVSQHDKIFEIMYWDLEQEDLIYEYTYEDVDTNIDPNYFYGSTRGNYYDNLGNITMTTYLWDKPVNKTYRIHICGHERRNEICEDLTVDVEEYCSVAPSCSSTSFSTDTSLAVGEELFDISALVYGGTFNDLSYSITAEYGSLFSIDSDTGKVTTATEFDEVFPWKSYSIVGYVYNTGACGYGQCQLTVNVTAINYPVEITNLPITVQIHEDTTSVQTLFTLAASDDNDGDTFTCEIVNTNSVEPFYLDRIPPVSGDYVIKNRENGVLTSATTTYSVSITCTDSHAGSDTDVLTIEVNPNEAPTFTTFGSGTTSISADPMDYNRGDTLYTVAATDTEGDDLTFTCAINASNIPFVCVAEPTFVDVKISRNLRIDDDNGQTYTITICLKDAKHSAQCGDLSVTFTRVKSRPEITNLPDSVSLPEDTAVGTDIFTPVIEDPDIGESHTVSIRVHPSSETSAFNLDTSTGKLTITQALDYERVNSYMFSYSVRDDYLDGQTEKTLKLAVTNVNEGNTISATTTTISFPEDTTVNTELPDPGFSCTDIDGDRISYAIQSGSHNSYFSIDSSTGRIRLIKEWDLESPSSLPTTTALTISCSDGALSSATVITLNIEDVNDNRPSIWVVSGTSPISISPSTPLYQDLMTFEASDNDFADDGNFEFSMLGNGRGVRLFRMVPVSGTARAILRLRTTPDFSNDKSFDVSVKVSDGESSPLFTPYTVAINYTAGDPDAKTKQAKKCLTCTSIGKGVVAAFVIEGIICIVAVVHIMVNCFSQKAKDPLQKFRTKIQNKTRLQRTQHRNPKKPDDIEMEKKRSDRKEESNSESNSSSDSSSSDSSDDDDRIKSKPARPDVGHSRFKPIYASSVLPSQGTGLPQPVYATAQNVPGFIVEHRL